MKLILSIIFFFIYLTLFSQEKLDSSDFYTEFYNQTLKDYFKDSSAYHDQKKYGCLLISSEIKDDRLVKKVGIYKLNFLAEKSLRSQIAWPKIRSNGRTLYEIKHKMISSDTIDINIISSRLKFERKNTIYSMACGGTMGYIPDGRFIKNNSGDWKYISYDELVKKYFEAEREYNKQIFKK